MNRILVDTGYWFGLYDKNDQWHSKAQEYEPFLRPDVFTTVLIPWPCLYETLHTQFVKKRGHIQFAEYLGNNRPELVDDSPYRAELVNRITHNSLLNTSRSLTDDVIHLMLEDKNLDITDLLSFNPRDFHGICAARNIKLWS